MPARRRLVILVAVTASVVAGGTVWSAPPPSGTSTLPTLPTLPETPPSPLDIPGDTGDSTLGTDVSGSIDGPDGLGPLDISSIIHVGDAKQDRPYDATIAAAFHDLEQWWAIEYPKTFGGEFHPLAGGIYAGYPERTDPIPGCGRDTTTYEEIYEYGAFYCGSGDFMAYDDGVDGLLAGLARDNGNSVLAVVLAHEYGHAIQERNGDLYKPVETVVTEQQADCYSGAWVRRAWNGDAEGITFTDADLRTAMIALVVVRDVTGVSVYEDGNHGSAFDRIGAFQHGFVGGVAACAPLVDTPLPVLPNQFRGAEDQIALGNSPFGYADNQIMGIAQNDLIWFWPRELARNEQPLPPLIQLRPSRDPATDNCGNPDLIDHAAVFCADSNEVLFNEAEARGLYDAYGDFAVAYVLGHAWADGIQHALGLNLTGEHEALVSDCLVGAWVGGAVGTADGFAEPSTTVAAADVRTMRLSPGDLDEAVQTALELGDAGLSDDVDGSAFEKVAYLRIGVINGTARCLAEAADLAD